MSSLVNRVAHISLDDRVGFLQDDVHSFVTGIDDIANAGGSSSGTRAYAAATYGVRKIAGDTISGLIGLPRLATSNAMMPSIVNAIINPLRAGRSLINDFNSMSLQDKLVTGLEVGLPFKANIESVAGRFANTATDYANIVLRNATRAEQSVTPLLQSIAADTEAELAGLDFRLKSVNSLARKIQTDSVLNSVSASEAASNIGDALRYTMILPEASFGKSILNVFDSLETAGMTKLKVGNSFNPGASYMGVNTNFSTAEGQVFELQFHTKDSFNVKQNINHSLYEEARLPATPAERIIELQRQMIINSSNISIPQDIGLINNFRIRH